MKVERRHRHEETGYDEGYDWWEYLCTINGRTYRAERRLGSGVTIQAPRRADASPDEINAVADFLMNEEGVRFVYWDDKQVRPPRLQEPRPLRPEERELLDYLLSVDDPHFEPLRQQVSYALVADDSRSPLGLEFFVAKDRAPPAKDLLSQVIVNATTIREDEWSHTVTLWLNGDYLGWIEVDWYVNEPERLPVPHELHPPRKAG